MRLTEDDAGQRGSQAELLLKVLGAECNASIDEYSIEHSIEQSEHVRTIADQRLDRLDHSTKSFRLQIQGDLVIQPGVRRRLG